MRYTADDLQLTSHLVDHHGNTVAALFRGAAIDGRNGERFADGAHKVVTTHRARSLGFRTRTFYGETAWMDADRFAYDILVASNVAD